MCASNSEKKLREEERSWSKRGSVAALGRHTHFLFFTERKRILLLAVQRCKIHHPYNQKLGELFDPFFTFFICSPLLGTKQKYPPKRSLLTHLIFLTQNTGLTLLQKCIQWGKMEVQKVFGLMPTECARRGCLRKSPTLEASRQKNTWDVPKKKEGKTSRVTNDFGRMTLKIPPHA